MPVDETTQGYLRGKDDLVALINQAKEELKKYFNVLTTSLELVHDPTGNDSLLLSVFTDLSVAEAQKKLRQFGFDWWYARSDYRLAIDLAYEK